MILLYHHFGTGQTLLTNTKGSINSTLHTYGVHPDATFWVFQVGVWVCMNGQVHTHISAIVRISYNWIILTRTAATKCLKKQKYINRSQLVNSERPVETNRFVLRSKPSSSSKQASKQAYSFVQLLLIYVCTVNPPIWQSSLPQPEDRQITPKTKQTPASGKELTRE